MKASFYIECVCHVCEAMLPVDMEMNFDLLFILIYHYMTFWLSYWHFWPNLFCLILSLVPYYVMRVIFNGNTVGEALFFLCYIPWHLMNLFIIHWVLTIVGMIYVDAEVLRKGNNELLDNLEEGVIIFEEKSGEILYHNNAATNPFRN